MRQEQNLFNKAIERVDFFLKISGINIKQEDEHRSMWQRMFHRWFYCLNLCWMNTDAFGFFGTMNQLTIPEITYMAPCVTLCFLGDIKSYCFISCHHDVVDLIRTLRKLQAIKETSREVEEEMKTRIPFMHRTNNMLLMAGLASVLTFCVSPAVIIWYHYSITGKVQLVLPFSVWYPFDPLDYRFWPIAMGHQLWTDIVTFFFVYGADCFYYTCCAFIHLQFRSLRLDMRQLARSLRAGRQEFGSLIHRHREIMRCVDLLETIYGKSTLFNALSSSLIICATGFNILAIDDLMTMAPFAPFLPLGSIQIFLFCYYGDLLMQDSMDIAEAVYDTEWYDLNASDMKYCLFMLTRAQKPCKITAYGFKDINMRGLSAILSSAWSYFTLLMTMYGKKN